MGKILPKVLPNQADGSIDLKDIERVMPRVKDEHICPIVGISLESSHNACGGRVLTPQYIRQVKELAAKQNAVLHLDGARCWNAAVALNMDIKHYVADFAMVNVCLSKGMGCPIGSLVVGSEEDIRYARQVRKMVGGAMR